MLKERFKVVPAVYVIMKNDNHILLLRRYNTGYQDGHYSLPAGHLDGSETVEDAIIREAKEEISVIIEKQNLKLAHVMHRKAEDYERLDFFYIIKSWQGEPKIMEPDKCDELKWIELDNFPENIVPEVNQAIENIFKSKSIYSDFGFN